jgi:hypothetical protein
MLNKKALAASVSAPPAVFVEDVFSTYLYTGNNTARTITNGIDLAGEGGLVWLRKRDDARSHFLFDTERGATNYIRTNLTSAQGSLSDTLTSFNADGFSLGAFSDTNSSSMASWTFRKAPKFFDVVTWTGNGANRTISHNLGSAPGMIIIKSTSGAYNWGVYHRSLGTSQWVFLNTTNAALAAGTTWQNTTPTATEFYINDNTNVNESGDTYVAYLFAHDAGGFGEEGTDNVISCGSFTTDGSGNATVSLGYEPQYLLFKSSSFADGWYLADTMRGWSHDWFNFLVPNTSQAEYGNSISGCIPNATGFTLSGEIASASETFIYMAIRRPMKVPTTGTEVFQPVAYTGTNVDNRLVDTGIVTDMVMARIRTTTSSLGFVTGDRLRGNEFLGTAVTNAEDSDTDTFQRPIIGYGNSFSAQNGFGVGNDATALLNGSSTSQLAYAFQRRPNFFDVVCYTGTGSATTVAHNLGVAPELMIIKPRSVADGWSVYHAALGNTNGILLNTSGAVSGVSWWNNTSPTSSVFTVSSAAAVNGSGTTYVAYLFATCAGVSKVGSYTGNGTSQTINCGFTAGARFVMIKRTDSTGDWVVLDTARGIVSGNDPFLQLNSTAAEVTGEDIVDPDSSGFIVNSTTENINASGGTYIFLAIA